MFHSLPHDSRSVFNQMQDAGITPDIWTYNSLANVLGSCGEWERAIGLLDDMRATGLKPDVVTYSTLVGACEKAGQVTLKLHDSGVSKWWA